MTERRFHELMKTRDLAYNILYKQVNELSDKIKKLDIKEKCYMQHEKIIKEIII